MGQHAPDLIDQRPRNTAARVAMPRRGQAWEQVGVIVAGDAERKHCVTVGPRIRNQRHRDDLAIVQDGRPRRRYGLCCGSSAWASSISMNQSVKASIQRSSVI
jgi:hypothetical protein